MKQTVLLLGGRGQAEAVKPESELWDRRGSQQRRRIKAGRGPRFALDLGSLLFFLAHWRRSWHIWPSGFVAAGAESIRSCVHGPRLLIGGHGLRFRTSVRLQHLEISAACFIQIREV